MKKNNEGMTLMEVLILIAIICALLVALIYLIKPQEQIHKARDAKRKNDLNELRKMLEDWYTDNSCYPTNREICFNSPSSPTCEICSSHPDSPSFSRFTTSVICDPESPLKNYLYAPSGDPNCPGAFIIYTKLGAAYSKENDLYNCSPQHGCGPAPFRGYDYLVTSPNAFVPVATNYYCYTNMSRCSSCGSYAACDNQLERGTCREVYPSIEGCCGAHPGAGYCY